MDGDNIPRLTVVELGRGDLNDIPARMRGAADAIEAGEHGDVQAGVAVVIDGNGVPVIFGWGKTTDIHSIGLLHLGAAWLAANRVER